MRSTPWPKSRIALVVLSFALAGSIPAVGAAQELVSDPCVGLDVQPTEDSVTFPSDEHRSIQSGVCGLSDGGTLRLLPGTYSGPIVVWGKDVRIKGEGKAENWPVIQMSEPTTVVESEHALGVITVGGDGSLELEKAHIIGGDAGVLSMPGLGSIDVKHAAFERNGRGILHLSNGDLTVKHSVFEETLWNGISFAPFDLQAENCGEMNVKHGFIGAVGGAGIYVRSCISTGTEQIGGHTISDVLFLGNKGGGIVSIGSIVNVHQVTILDARYWGILFVNTLGLVSHSNVARSVSGPFFNSSTGQFENRYGDGITIFSTNDPSTLGGFPPPSDVIIKDTWIQDVDRAGIALFGGKAALKNNTISGADFELEGEDNEGYPDVFEDLGGNLCGVPPDGPCVVVSIGLKPPELTTSFD